jgi:hypothetical protein
MILRPITRDEANAAIRAWHRHHEPIRQALVKVGAFTGDVLVAAVTVELPRAQPLCDGFTYEVTRLACEGAARLVAASFDDALTVLEVRDTRRCAASMLLGAAWGAMRAQGVRRLVSYTRVDEDGTCYRAAGWVAVALVRGRAWDTGNKADRWLPGLYAPTTEVIDRVRWEIGPGAATTRVHRDVTGTWCTNTEART